jgi:RNA polymerase sigma-70 factor (ECF subfamily)
VSLQEPTPPPPSGAATSLPGDRAVDDLTSFDLSPVGRALIAQAMRGDHDALRRLWNEHRRWVAAILLAHMPRSGVAGGGGVELDDLLQEVAVTVVSKISGLRDEAAFKPWLRAVAMSIAKTSGRRTKVRKEGWLKLVSFKGGNGGAGGGADRRDDLDDSVGGPSSARAQSLAEGRRLMDLASELPDGYREPLLLKCVQGMSYKQIGEVMGLPDTTIETRIARARRMLRERAEKHLTTETQRHGEDPIESFEKAKS